MLFGYDLGVTGELLLGSQSWLPSKPGHQLLTLLLFIAGGVSSFPTFLDRFFPEVLAGKSKNAYCTYNSQKLQMFTSSYFLAGKMLLCMSSDVASILLTPLLAFAPLLRIALVAPCVLLLYMHDAVLLAVIASTSLHLPIQHHPYTA